MIEKQMRTVGQAKSDDWDKAKRGCHVYIVMSHTIHIPVKNSHFYSFLGASGIDYTDGVTKSLITVHTPNFLYIVHTLKYLKSAETFPVKVNFYGHFVY